MNKWMFKNAEHELTLAMGQLTVLKGDREKWRELVGMLDSYFNQQGKEVTIWKDGKQIRKKHMNYYAIYENGNNIEPILKDLKQGILDKLILSPIYKEFIEIWEELQEEVQFIGECEHGKTGIKYELASMTKTILEKSLSLRINEYDNSKLDIIKLILGMSITKPTLVFVEGFRSGLNDIECANAEGMLQKMARRGMHVIVLDDNLVGASVNYYYQDLIVNKLEILGVKKIILESSPILSNSEDFLQAINWSIEAVDKSKGKVVELELQSVDNLCIFTLIYLIFTFLKWPLIVDFRGVRSDLIEYLAEIVSGEV
ncbi:hypothetical protein HCB21_10115 [Listeria booriae]|uniref:hypothetical protein n=1 Tax=Listeria booriae TaxID=1552123 RepID=UPI001626241A|nr:hypothetical protein [Listeria booriae]MBC2160125.1 hypothetical protein [Listeria booriae]MBC2163833.1 hypothetical protein [Listeria booriae]